MKLIYKKQEGSINKLKGILVVDNDTLEEVALIVVDHAIQVFKNEIYPDDLKKIIAVAKQFNEIYNSL